MPLVIHKAFIKSSLKKTKITYSDTDSESDIEDVNPKKKRRITIYNKFMRVAMPALHDKYPEEKQCFYMQMVSTMWRLLPTKHKKSFAKMKIV
jgi:hypothetical protein